MGRTVEFLPDGVRVRVSASEVVAAWVSQTTRIPPQYACGTAQHESSYTVNEVDTEVSGFVSSGIFQLSNAEANDAGMAGADLLNLADSAKVFASVSESRLDRIISAAGLDASAPLPSDVWGYLAFYHNQGATAIKSIQTYGLDWEAFKARPQNEQTQRLFSYGDDCISGGSNFDPSLLSVTSGSVNVLALAAVGVGIAIMSRYA